MYPSTHFVPETYSMEKSPLQKLTVPPATYSCHFPSSKYNVHFLSLGGSKGTAEVRGLVCHFATFWFFLQRCVVNP
jgi:hypothetical protein